MQVNESRVIAADPAKVWKVGGDTANVADWIPALESSYQRGDVRYTTFAGGGGEAVERIVEHDDRKRRYVYDYVSGPLALESYRSVFAVVDHPDGARITWDAEFRCASAEEDIALAQSISEIYRAALDELENRLVHDRV
ncbi:SRPBCC family protein [Rhodococcus sp. HM1]|uniref:SRPBCC family protein n=1 Tax=Rhodococcus sp. HM1 TaxID=2937759 RepID=UPI00200A9CB2|nr:SRPBCC family protein [Rhodococcus sp. HM1]